MSVWNETVPSGTSAVGAFPPYARPVWATIGSGMGVEHYYPGSGGGSDASAGDINPGGSRAFVDVQSNSSAPNSQMTGRMFYASDASRLFIYDSTGTYLAGTPFLSEGTISTTSAYLARQSGSFTTAAQSGNTDITFPVPFAAQPTMTQTVGTPGNNASILVGYVAGQSTTTKFRSAWSGLGTTLGTFTIFWEAFGRVSDVSF